MYSNASNTLDTEIGRGMCMGHASLCVYVCTVMHVCMCAYVEVCGGVWPCVVFIFAS